MGITSKLAEIAARVGYIQKKGENTAQGYRYARAEDVFQVVTKAMSELGVACVRSESQVESLLTGLGKSGNTIVAVVRLSQTFRDAESGEEAVFQAHGEGADSGDKAIMKANTAALKYLFSEAFRISWGDDPEATDPETGEATGSKAPPKPRGGGKKGKGELKALLTAIASAPDLETLERDVRPQVLALDNQSKDYAEAKQAYIGKRDGFKQTTIPGA